MVCRQLPSRCSSSTGGVPEDEYRSLRETSYLLASPVNAARLRASIAAEIDGETTERELVDAPE